jgi:hypothetical protein
VIDRPQVHEGGAAIRRARHRGRIQEIIAVSAVKASDIVAEALQMSGNARPVKSQTPDR